MKKIFIALLATLPWLAGCAPEAPVSSAAMGEGHCLLDKLNEGADPTPMCVEPMDQATCTTLAEGLGEASMGFAEFAGGTFAAGSCPTEGLTGTCSKESGQDHYYGDTKGMDIGCKFSGGEWIAAG